MDGRRLRFLSGAYRPEKKAQKRDAQSGLSSVSRGALTTRDQDPDPSQIRFVAPLPRFPHSALGRRRSRVSPEGRALRHSHCQRGPAAIATHPHCTRAQPNSDTPISQS